MAKPWGAVGLMHPKKVKREIEKQDARRRAAEIGGSVRAGFDCSTPERNVQQRVDAEIRRYLHAKEMQREAANLG